MFVPRTFRVGLTALAAALLLGPEASADDWPQFRGPERDGVWRESGLMETLPEEPLEAAWRVPVALGYAGPAVAEGRVYVFEYERRSGDVTNNPGGRDKLEGVERLRALDAATGDELWRYEYDRPYFISYPEGPRCTPTVAGDRVLALGAEGDLTCLRVSDGTVVWKKNFAEAYGAPTPQWGHSSHPLVDGDTVYCLAGGEGSVVVALDLETGEERWTALSTPSLDNDAGYCPPTMMTIAGRRQLVAYTPIEVAGLEPTTGEVLWSFAIEPAYSMSINAPQPSGDGLFVTGHGAVSAFFTVPAAAGGQPEVVWAGTSRRGFGSANATPIVGSDGVVFGCDSNSSELVGVDLADGARLWETTLPTLGKERVRRVRHGTAFIVRQGDTDRYWLAAETGDLVLAKLTRAGYEELGRTPLLAPTGDTFGRDVWWSHPAYANQAVFARNDEELVRVNLAAE